MNLRATRSTYPVSGLVGEIQLALHGLKRHPGRLGHHLEVHGLVGLQADHQLVASTLATEDVSRDVTELHTYLGLALV